MLGNASVLSHLVSSPASSAAKGGCGAAASTPAFDSRPTPRPVDTLLSLDHDLCPDSPHVHSPGSPAVVLCSPGNERTSLVCSRCRCRKHPLRDPALTDWEKGGGGLGWGLVLLSHPENSSDQ